MKKPFALVPTVAPEPARVLIVIVLDEGDGTDLFLIK